MTSSNSVSNGWWAKALVAALVLVLGAWCLRAWRTAPEAKAQAQAQAQAQARNNGCLPGQYLLIPSGMAMAHFVDTKAVGCGTLPMVAVGWAQVLQAGRR
jgi:hypothetical protein